MIHTLERGPDAEAPAKLRPKKLTLVRRFWRRSRRYLLMGVMAFTLSFGLVAVPVVKAEADLLSAATIAEINGAMRMPLTQVVVGAIRAHPVGFALVGVGALALYAYSERDQWMPFVTGLFGVGEEQPKPGGLSSPNVNLEMVGLTHNPSGFSVTVKNVGAGLLTGHHVTSAIQCKNSTTGAVLAPIATTNALPGLSAGQSYSVPRACGAGYFPVAAAAYPPCGYTPPGLTACTAKTSLAGPSAMVLWGTWFAPTDSFDPRGEATRYITYTECIDPAGNKTIIEATSSGVDQMMKMPSCAAAIPGSHGTGKMWIDGYAPGSTVPQRLYDVDPMNDPDHPLCSPSRPGSGCTLSVSIDGKPCVIGDVQCENWTEIRRDTAARVSCNYGPYAVGVEQCNILERAYQIGGAPATEENIDGNPDTAKWSQPNGDPWKPKPQPEPGTGTNQSTLPTTGTNPGSTPGESGENCLASGWSWNPVSWVMVPVQCALQWAFVPPKLKVETALQSLQPRLEARGVTPFVTPFMDSLGGLGGSGCSGPPIDLAVIKLPVFYPFSACAAPMSTIASGVSAFFALTLVVQGGMSCIRGVAAAFGFNWGLGSSRTEDES